MFLLLSMKFTIIMPKATATKENTQKSSGKQKTQGNWKVGAVIDENSCVWMSACSLWFILITFPDQALSQTGYYTTLKFGCNLSTNVFNSVMDLIEQVKDDLVTRLLWECELTVLCYFVVVTTVFYWLFQRELLKPPEETIDHGLQVVLDWFAMPIIIIIIIWYIVADQSKKKLFYKF